MEYGIKRNEKAHIHIAVTVRKSIFDLNVRFRFCFFLFSSWWGIYIYRIVSLSVLHLRQRPNIFFFEYQYLLHAKQPKSIKDISFVLFCNQFHVLFSVCRFYHLFVAFILWISLPVLSHLQALSLHFSLSFSLFLSYILCAMFYYSAGVSISHL